MKKNFSSTIVSAMKFNHYSGAIIADVQVTSGQNVFDSYEKLHLFGNEQVLSVFGGTGYIHVIQEVFDRIGRMDEKETAAVTSGKTFVNAVGRAMSQYKSEEIVRIYNHKLAEGNYWKLFNKSPEGLNNLAWEYLKKQFEDSFDYLTGIKEYFLSLSYDKNGISLHLINFDVTGTRLVPKQYEAIGSAAKIVEDRLEEFLESYSIKDRENIPVLDGIGALVFAVHRACKRDKGVGGVPQLYVIDEGDLYAPNERCMRLATKIAVGAKKGVLSRNAGRNFLNELVLNQKPDPDAVWDELESIAGKKKPLRRFLRGERV